MAGRKAAPKQAAPKTTNGQRRSRVETKSETPVDRSRMEEDLVKLIDSLTEWTREMQAVRPARRKRRHRDDAPPPAPKKVAVKASPTPLYRAGEPPHRVDEIHRPGRGGVAGLRRGRRPAPSRPPAEAHRAPGPPPPLRQRDRVAVHHQRPRGLPVAGGSPPAIPPGRSPTRPAPGRDYRRAGRRRMGRRVACPSRQVGPGSRRRRLPPLAGGSASSGRPWVARSSTWPPKPLNPCTE